MPYSGDEKPDLNDIEHFGVKGMKWGVRRVSTSEIKGARQRLKKKNDAYGELEDKLSYGRDITPAQKKSDARIMGQLKKMDADFKKDPDRYVAARTTRGEKAVAIILGGPVGLAAIGAHSAYINTAERRQQR